MPYDVHEMSEVAGLSVSTLQSYTSRRKSDLVRGLDYFVRRTSPTRRQLMFTYRGALRLVTRDYRLFADSKAPSRQFAWNGEERVVPLQGSSQERRMRLKSNIATAARQYLERPCTVPGCPCIVHRLGMPQADIVAEVMRAAKGYHPRSSF